MNALDQPPRTDAFRRTEWWDRREGVPPAHDVEYPHLSRAGAFLCTNGRCSLPIYDTEALVRAGRPE